MVAQLVRALACHARGRGFEPHPSRHSQYASVAQLVEQRTENPRVVGSIPTGGTKDVEICFSYPLICGFSSSGRAPPYQGGGSEFEPRNPLQSPRKSGGNVFTFVKQACDLTKVKTHGAMAKW